MNLIPLEQLSFTTFKELLKTSFWVELAPERRVQLELIEAVFTGESGTAGPNRPKYENFSLIFSGAAEARLAQRIYRFTHENIGSFDLFIVPIAVAGGTICYQAVFNRLLPPA